jgi:hypothetical protein
MIYKLITNKESEAGSPVFQVYPDLSRFIGNPCAFPPYFAGNVRILAPDRVLIFAQALS